MLLQVNIWRYDNQELLHEIDTGHSANVFCTKFVPETSDEVVVSGAGDAQVPLLWDIFSLVCFPVTLRHCFQVWFIDCFPGSCFQFVSFKWRKA
jgi:WD40 repeat protein